MKSFLTALQFLTRIHLTEQRVWTDEDFGRAVVYFPLVGLLIGVILACINGAFGLFFSPLFTAVLTVAVWFFITGGLHADGDMDTADGLFSGRGRERMLEIMKDSRVGANGVIAFFFLAALKIVSLAELLQPWPLLIAVPAAARFAALVSIFKFPYARSEGLGRAYAAHGPSRVLMKGCVEEDGRAIGARRHPLRAGARRRRCDHRTGGFIYYGPPRRCHGRYIRSRH